ncbi:MAG: histidine--tRNA ligase [Gemmatimonadota bacterium]
MTFRTLPGFRDFAPDDLAFRAHIFGAWRRVAMRYGFEEYDGPPLEPLDLYTAKSGDEIVGQLYNFTDKGGREVSLRPEMTPTLARMVAERANGLKKPIRWFSIPQLFRYERQQRGRLREHFQLNCDLIGEAGPLADAEVIALSIDIMRELGLGASDFKVRLSDRRLLDGILASLSIAEEHRPLLMHALDKLGRTEYAGRKQAFLDAAGADRQGALELVEGLRDKRTWSELAAALAPYPNALAAGEPLRLTIEALVAMGLGDFIELDLSIVRGLAYYTGTVFELFDAQRTLRAICGGGRYDTLLANLGGVDLPALGFGMGDVVLGELLKERGLKPDTPASVDLFVASVTAEDEPFVLAIAHELRDAGLRVEYAFHTSGLGKQLKVADARGARLAVVIGPDDRARGEVQLKNFADKSQQGVALADLARVCRDLLSGTS